jgi:hypothetical protein
MSSTEPIPPNDPRYRNLPVSHANAILGVANPDGSFSTFADWGDSGSLITRMMPDEDGVEVGVSEGIGILYAIVWEEPKQVFVGLYLPIARVIQEIKRETGIDITLNVEDVVPSAGVWTYDVHGWGKSMYDLK